MGCFLTSDDTPQHPAVGHLPIRVHDRSKRLLVASAVWLRAPDSWRLVQPQSLLSDYSQVDVLATRRIPGACITIILFLAM